MASGPYTYRPLLVHEIPTASSSSGKDGKVGNWQVSDVSCASLQIVYWTGLEQGKESMTDIAQQDDRPNKQ